MAVAMETRNLDDLDHRILTSLQYDFPLSERPYDVLAHKLGITAEVLRNRVEQLLEQGLIRRIGASLDSRKLGYASTLASLRVPPELVEKATELTARLPEITHSYLRNDSFNVWFTVIARDRARIDEILTGLRQDLSLAEDDVINLPVKRLFKLDARFKKSD